MPILIVERSFDDPLDSADELFETLGPCLAQTGVEWIHSYLSKDGSRMFCVFQAADAETVRVAHRMARVDFDCVWVATRLSG